MSVHTDLIEAVRYGKLERVKELINSYGLSYSKPWAGGYVLLCDALKRNHTAIAKLLLTSGSRVCSKNPSTITPLHYAVMKGEIDIIEMILDKGGDVNHQNKCGRTPLHFAVENNKFEVTKLLLNHGASANAKDNNGKRPLHFAIAQNKLEFTLLLLRYGAEATAIDHWGKSPLHYVSELGNEDALKLFLNRGADINSITNDNMTPLLIATNKGHKTIVKLLLQRGAKVDYEDKDGKTALHLAVEKGYLSIVEDILKYCPDKSHQSNISSLKIAVHGFRGEYKLIVDALLEYGFHIEPEDANDHKLLHDAIKNESLKIVEALLKYGVDVNTVFKDCSMFSCFTPLHAAAENKQEGISKLLISYGADVNALDRFGKTPIYYAIKNADLKITNLLLTNKAHIKDSPDLLNIAVDIGCIKIVEALLQYGADINACDKDGRTALHFTALSKSTYLPIEHSDINIKGEIAKLLLSKGANVDARTKTGETLARKQEISMVIFLQCADVNDGDTALHIAVNFGQKEVVKVLLEYGAKVDSKNVFGLTPLHKCAFSGYKDIIEILLNFGANINSEDTNGTTALHIACWRGNLEVVCTLLDYGSDINIISESDVTALDNAYIGIKICNTHDDYGDYYDPDRDLPYILIIKAFDRHIVKMKTANLYLYEKYLPYLRRITYGLRNFQIECEKEIASMKIEKINNSNITFYDILAKATSSLATYMKNENIVKVLKSDDYKTKFPIYASMIKSHLRKSMERKELLKQQHKIFYLLFNNYPEFPCDCAERVISYLNNEELKILMNACKSLNISNTDIKENISQEVSEA